MLESKSLYFFQSCAIFRRRSKVNLRLLHQKKVSTFLNEKIMPKRKTVSAELKEVRMKAKTALLNKSPFPPNEMYLCVLGNGAPSSCRSLFLVTDQGRYLFNCGEGTQRLANEYRMKLAKLDHVFFTYKSWENIGGLLGLSLTIQDIGVPEINIHGPPGVELLFDNSKEFILKKDLKIVTQNYLNEKFVDNCMEVRYIPIFPEKRASTPEMKIRNPLRHQNSDSESSGTGSEGNSSQKQSKKIRLSEEPRQDMVMAYACKGHSKPGRLQANKCVEQGVPLGPLMGDLKNGKDIVLPSGKVIYSKDVVSEEQHCPIFLVVECPSKSFLVPFVNEEKFRHFQGKSSDSASLVVHFTPPDVLKTQKYQEWMKSFPEETVHFLINSESLSLSSVAVHRVQYKLNLLYEQIFPVLEEIKFEDLKTSKEKNVIQTKTLDRYYLRPPKGLDRSGAVRVDPKEYIDEAMRVDGFQASLKMQKDSIQKEHHSHSESTDKFPEVTFFGTGSSIPSKIRNVSAILIKASASKNILLDCGEGTCGQMVRFYGHDYRRVFRETFCVFNSHMHADHHLGLIQFLKFRQKAFKVDNIEYEPLILIGPYLLKVWLKKYHRAFEPITFLYRFFPCSSLQNSANKTVIPDFFESCRDITISTVPVDHCADAHGFVLVNKEADWKLVYSGDTLPCQNLVAAGKNCSILIHEATFEDDLANEASLKKHCTTGQAIEIGEQMNARYTILTHFSQRYAKIPVFNGKFHKSVGCAFDNMRVIPGNIPILPALIPTLNCLFAEDVEELITKGNKRQKRLELIENIYKKELPTEILL